MAAPRPRPPRAPPPRPSRRPTPVAVPRGTSGTPAASSMARRRAAALCSVSSNSFSGTEAGDDPGARVDVRLAVLEDRAPDGDRGVEVAVVAEVADGAAVQPAALALGRGDELHRPDLRGARQGAGREHGPQRVERIELRAEARLDVRHEVEDVAVALDLHVLADADRAGARDPAEVVPPEVDQHHVLGALLRIALELLGQQRILVGVDAARPGPGDRVGRQPVALGLEQQLGRRPDDLEGGRPDEEQVRARVDPAEGPVQPDPVERRAGRGVGRQVERLAPGEDDLDRLAGRDGVLGDLDGVDVLVAAQAGRGRSAEGVRDRSRDRRRTIRAPRAGARHLGRSRSCAPLERLEDRLLGDPVARFRGWAHRCGARRWPTGCGSGGRRRARGRSR